MILPKKRRVKTQRKYNFRPKFYMRIQRKGPFANLGEMSLLPSPFITCMIVINCNLSSRLIFKQFHTTFSSQIPIEDNPYISIKYA